PSNNVNNVSGTLVNNNINASFTDGSGNTTTLTGSVTTGTYGTPGAIMGGNFSSSNGDSGTWSANE
ncbi:MAG: hypothetical protein WA666_01505, partial [Nitrospirota bacterium]